MSREQVSYMVVITSPRKPPGRGLGKRRSIERSKHTRKHAIVYRLDDKHGNEEIRVEDGSSFKDLSKKLRSGKNGQVRVPPTVKLNKRGATYF